MKITYTKHPFSLYVSVDVTPGATFPIVATDGQADLNADLIVAVKDYIQSFVNSYAISGEIEQAESQYGNLLLPPEEGSNIRSLRVNSERFLLDVLTPDMKKMGYIVEAA